MNEQKMANLKVNIFSAIFGILQSCLVLLFPTGLESNSEFSLHFFKLIIVFIAFTILFLGIRSLIKLHLRISKDKDFSFSKASEYLYCIASAIGIFILIMIRPIDFIGYIILGADIIINLILISGRRKSYDVNSFYRDLYEENRKTNPLRKQLKKQEINWSITGMILGIISAIPLLLAYLFIYSKNIDAPGDKKEFMLFITIVISLLSLIFMPKLLDEVNYKAHKNNLNKKNSTQKYWLLKNICTNSYIIFSAISHFTILAFVVKIDYFYAIGIALVAYFISKKRAEISYEPSGDDVDPGEILARYREKEMAREARKKDFGIQTTTFEDKFGNKTGSATTYKVGDIEFTDVKDRNGNIVGKGSSYEVGGVRFSDYKKQ